MKLTLLSPIQNWFIETQKLIEVNLIVALIKAVGHTFMKYLHRLNLETEKGAQEK